MGGGSSKVVEEWHQGTEWYRVWSSGLIEQGGTAESPGDKTNVTLHKVFTSSDYSILNTQDIPSGGQFEANIVVIGNNKTTSAFQLRTFHTGNSIYWFARGY